MYPFVDTHSALFFFTDNLKNTSILCHVSTVILCHVSTVKILTQDCNCQNYAMIFLAEILTENENCVNLW